MVQGSYRPVDRDQDQELPAREQEVPPSAGREAPAQGSLPGVPVEPKAKPKPTRARKPGKVKRAADPRLGPLLGYYRERLLSGPPQTKAHVSQADAHALGGLLAEYGDDDLRRALDGYAADPWPRAVGWALVNFPKRVPGYLAKAATAPAARAGRNVNDDWKADIEAKEVAASCPTNPG